MAESQTPSKKFVVVKLTPEEINKFKVELDALLKKYDYFMEPVLSGFPNKIEPIITVKKRVFLPEKEEEKKALIKTTDEKAIN